MKLVIDASVAIKWLVEEEHSHLAGQLLGGQHELFAPRLMASEVSNGLWQKTRRGAVQRDRVGGLAAAIAAMNVDWAEDETLSADAVRLAVALDRPVYDCTYLALAHRIGATLVTADERFANALSGTEHGGSVVVLKDMAEE